MTRTIIAAFVVLLTAACASLPLHTMIRPTAVADGGFCTAWAVGPTEWVTASHCTNHGPMTIDGVATDVLLNDPEADLALLSGPAAPHWFKLGKAPQWGDTVTVLGYSHQFTGKALLRFEVKVVDPDNPFYNDQSHDLIWAGANGLPGLSGGAVLNRKGQAVSAVTGGGLPQTHAQLIGAGVTWERLRAFLARAQRLDKATFGK